MRPRHRTIPFPSTRSAAFALCLAALSALHSQLVALDLIYVAVAQRTYERTTEAFEITARAVQAHRLYDEPTSHRAKRKQA